MVLSLFFFGRGDQSPFDTFSEPSERFAMWDSALSRKFAQDGSAIASTRVDWVETPEAHVFKADLPGLKKEEIKVQVEDGRTLQISDKCKKEEVDNTDKWHRVGQFTVFLY
ncbi:hypothetical protein O6H91_02G040100 [Diphasiastrum complanatum]|uniref:Uncharacterized protein n=2 Tax=Diphasiastrum complanatum TaxID=34168 RepID=A0ACC2EEN3_DIPCM|nr:hypothetical protein O6H91_Y249800 [Diphasiastrum complanatum]KAJ7564929.1 hypothetical protein O6H91_02G040000 [Diphasiastrum complanatum]KAJ7564930.1 hypothetical protein O6H91_02G040100 [Diphasiastrum complanatum]